MPETGQRNDPFVAFRFEVRVTGRTLGGFSECSGLQLETETQDYLEGGENFYVHKFPTRTKQTNLVLKRGIVDRALWDWYAEITEGTISRHAGSILLKDAAGSDDVVVWEFVDAFPSKWIGPELNAGQSTIAIDTIELCHQGLTRRT
jgi:phage tail-like protein